MSDDNSFNNSFVTFICVMVVLVCMWILSGVIAISYTKETIRNQMIEQNLGKWAIDPKTGVKIFDSPIQYLK